MMVKKILVATGAILLAQLLFCRSNVSRIEPIQKKTFDYDYAYSRLLEYIKIHEGYRAKMYYCPAGYPTIGYGHLIRSHEQHLCYTSLSKEQADELLKKDFNKAIQFALKLSPELELNSPQLLAVSHFIFGHGCFNYARSTLRKEVKNGNKLGVSREFRRWITYKNPKGEIVISANAKAIAEYNVKLFNTKLK